VEREPSVDMSYGVTSVSGRTTRTVSAGMFSTSPTIWAIAVSEAWPMSVVLQ
jgi:hypothetical protein